MSLLCFYLIIEFINYYVFVLVLSLLCFCISIEFIIFLYNNRVYYVFNLFLKIWFENGVRWFEKCCVFKYKDINIGLKNNNNFVNIIIFYFIINKNNKILSNK